MIWLWKTSTLIVLYGFAVLPVRWWKYSRPSSGMDHSVTCWSLKSKRPGRNIPHHRIAVSVISIQCKLACHSELTVSILTIVSCLEMFFCLVQAWSTLTNTPPTLIASLNAKTATLEASMDAVMPCFLPCSACGRWNSETKTDLKTTIDFVRTTKSRRNAQGIDRDCMHTCIVCHTLWTCIRVSEMSHPLCADIQRHQRFGNVVTTSETSRASWVLSIYRETTGPWLRVRRSNALDMCNARVSLSHCVSQSRCLSRCRGWLGLRAFLPRSEADNSDNAVTNRVHKF